MWHHRVDAVQKPDHTARSELSSRISQNRFGPQDLVLSWSFVVLANRGSTALAKRFKPAEFLSTS